MELFLSRQDHKKPCFSKRRPLWSRPRIKESGLGSAFTHMHPGGGSCCSGRHATGTGGHAGHSRRGGDLTHRLLVPALYDLTCNKFLPDDFRIIGVSAEDLTSASWKASLRAKMETFTQDSHAEFYTPKIDETAWSWLTERMTYQALDFTSVDAVSTLARDIGDRNAVFYLATPPRFFEPAAETLAKAGLLKETDNRFRRLVIEKPFGTDLQSAQALNAHLLSFLQESQIYRVDHFLGKETVQNLLALRFSNLLFDPLWRCEYIDHIQITAAEILG